MYKTDTGFFYFFVAKHRPYAQKKTNTWINSNTILILILILMGYIYNYK